MKDKILRIAFVLLIAGIIIFEFAFVSKATDENSLICWGLKRSENHEQPILDTDSLKILNEYSGISIGNEDDNSIYLTFDLGYEAGYTEQILDILKENDVKAIFFITGHYLNSEPDLVKRMIEEGHIVGNHTVNHKCLAELSDEEIENEIMDLHNALYEKFGYEMTYFRPPQGEFSERVLEIAQNLGYTAVLWSNAYDDWDENNQGREEYGKSKILDYLHNGCVLLLHGTSKDNANILDDVIKEAINMGYEFKSIDEMNI